MLYVTMVEDYIFTLIRPRTSWRKYGCAVINGAEMVNLQSGILVSRYHCFQKVGEGTGP